MQKPGVRIYRDYHRVCINSDSGVSPSRNSGVNYRGEIREFSKKSQKRMLQYLSSCVAKYDSMGTLTVREFEADGKVFKRHVDEFFRWFLDAQKRSAVSSRSGGRVPERQSIFWFLEFQERGAPHVHFFYTGFVQWQPAARKWSRIVGDPMVEKAGTRFESLKKGRGGCISYARKYANKQNQKIVPENYRNVGRFWGVRGERATVAADTVLRSSKAVALVRNDVWKLVKELELQRKIRVFRWERGNGVTIVTLDGETTQSLGLMQEIDKAIILDLRDRAVQKVDHAKLEHADRVEKQLESQHFV